MTWQEHEEHGHGVTTKVKPNENPVLVAVFDEDERVTQPTAALQVEEQIWAAQGYADAKAKYCDDIDNESED